MPHDVVTVWVTTVIGLFFCREDSKIIYVLLTEREVKMAGYNPTSFFAFLWTATKSRTIKTEKKRGYYSAILTEKAWSIKGLSYSKNISLW